jgi:hypothetical protein
MTRTLWFAVLCLAGLGTAIAIRAAIPVQSPIAKLAQDQNTLWGSFGPNEASKSDRLELPSVSLEAETETPNEAQMPVEAPSVDPEAADAAPVHEFREANAKVASVAPSHGHSKSKKRAGRPTARAASAKPQPFHCRQDAAGGLLRALDLTPRCDL